MLNIKYPDKDKFGRIGIYCKNVILYYIYQKILLIKYLIVESVQFVIISGYIILQIYINLKAMDFKK